MNFIIADDDSEDRSFLMSAFATLNNSISFTEFDDADDFLKYLNENNKVDLIICDLNMPKVSGMELLRKVKCDERYHHIPVVVLSTSSSEAEQHKLSMMGASAFHTKPFDFESYISIARSILQGYQSNAAVA